ncbi:MAG: response regulator [Longicatena sp.]
MYKVLIADDERIIRITLKNMIDWKAFDCEVVGTAKDGNEALALFDDLQPEIIITDLMMPGMDGIELITKIKERSKNSQVIALSNYSDFEYVRDAMKAGAFDYLLKVTLEKKDLENIITQVKENCKADNINHEEESESALNELQQCLVLMKNEHVVGKEKIQKTLEQPIFQAYEDGYQLAYFRIDNINHLYQNKIKDHTLLHTHLSDLIKESIPVAMEHLLLFISNHSGVILFHSKEKLRILNICNSMMRNIHQYMDVHLSITLSDVLYSFDAFFEIYEKLLKSQTMRFYEQEGSLIQCEDKIEFHDLKMDDIHFHLDILEAVNHTDFDKVNQLEEEMILYMKENEIKPSVVIEYFIFIFNNIEGNEIAKGMKQALAFDKLAARIRMCETIDKLKEVVDDSFQQIEIWMKDASTNKYRQEVLDIMAYVEAHLDQRLTLKVIATDFEMSESSLSRTFKSETGKNLNYYINEKKMKKAMDILSQSGGMVKDAATAVGMDDQLYFNKVFKKFYNISPSEVKKKRISEIVE